MTLHHTHPNFAQPRTRPVRTPRLRLKPKAPSSGAVDGAWWPHTRVLTRELPDLIEVLSVRLGPIDRVLYNVREWYPEPSCIHVGGRPVRLDGYRFQPSDTIYVAGLRRTKIVLLVVPPDTDPCSAHDILMATAQRGNRAPTRELLLTGATEAAARVEVDAAEQRWDSDGGHGYR